MQKYTKVIALLFVFLLPTFVSAEESSVSSSSVQKKANIFELDIYPNPKTYPQEFADTGAHGSVVLTIKLDDESKVVFAEVKKSSHDEVLDNMALKLLLTPVKLKFKDGNTYSKEEIKVSYRRDDIFRYKYKTCNDVNIEANYFSRIYPDKPIREMEFWTFTSGMMFLAYSSQKAYVNLDSRKILDDTIAECFAHPENNAFDTYLQLAKIKPTQK